MSFKTFSCAQGLGGIAPEGQGMMDSISFWFDWGVWGDLFGTSGDGRDRLRGASANSLAKQGPSTDSLFCR